MKKNIASNFVHISIIAIVLFFCLVTYASAASLSLSPASGSYFTGDNVSVQIVVSSADQPINAVSGTLTFPADKLQIVSLSKNSSIVNFWATEPTFSNSSGKVHFEGIILSPGFQGTHGVVLTLYMKAVSAGDASLVSSAVSVLANDGQGTDVTQGATGGTFSIKLAKVKPKVEPKTVSSEPISDTTSVSPTFKPADILLGNKYGASAIIGTSDYGKSQVLLTFVAPDGTKIFITGVSDNDGGFSLLVPNTLKRGTYTVTAVLIKDDGTHSASSNEILIQIGNIFSDVSWGLWLIVAILVAVVMYLLVRVFFHIQKNQKVRASNKREVREAENVLHKTFDVLRDDIADRRRPSEFKKDINDVEKVIDGEIKDLET